MKKIIKKCKCNIGKIIGARGGCGICSPVFLPMTYKKPQETLNHPPKDGVNK